MIDKNLIKGSLVLLIAFNIFNFINFMFHFFMARFLTLAEFGILSTLLSILYIFGVFSESIQLIITKYTTETDDKGKIKNILKKTIKKSAVVSGILFFVYLIIAIPLSNILEIDYLLLGLNGLMIFGYFMIPITRGAMQGQKKFASLGVSMMLEASVRIIFAIILVFAGWKVYGAVIGTILGIASAFFISLFVLRGTFKAKEKPSEVSGIYSYSKPAFFIILTILAFYSIDVIIARIFFSPEVAGEYSIASILAKTIFLATQPIARAMFPLSIQDKARKKENGVFRTSIILLFMAIFCALVLFFFFPEFIIKVFSGKTASLASAILIYLAIGVSLLSITNLVLLHKLSIGKTKNYWFLGIFVIIEVITLSYFATDLYRFSIAFVFSSAAFLYGSLMVDR